MWLPATSGPADSICQRLSECPRLARDDPLDHTAGKTPILVISAASRRAMDDLFSDLHVAGVHDSGMQAGVPKHEDIEIGSVRHQHGQPIAAVVEGAVLAGFLAGDPDYHLIFERTTRTAFD
jgi:hypothetical protein